MMSSIKSSERGVEKRGAILEVAARIFAERGYGETDVQLIADAAGVGKGTVYRHFGTKQDLFLAAADEGMKRLEAALLRVVGVAEEPVEAIRRAALTYAEFFHRNPHFLELILMQRAEFRGSIPDTHLVYRAKNRGAFEAIFRAGVEAGTFCDLDIDEVHNMLGNLLFGTVVTARLGGGSWERLRRSVEYPLQLVFRGILADRPERP